MLEAIPVAIIVGLVLGFLAGLGIGGGSLLILWLTLAVHMPQEIARSINLLFFIPAAIIACVLRCRQGALHIKNVLPAIIAGCVSAAVFTFIGSAIDTALLRKPFGFLLIITGLRELFYRPRKAK